MKSTKPFFQDLWLTKEVGLVGLISHQFICLFYACHKSFSLRSSGIDTIRQQKGKKHLETLQPPANNQKVTFAKTAETSTSNTSSKY